MISRQRYTVPLPRGRVLALGDRTLVMGIINVTPDSFADGGVRFDADIAARDALLMVAQGADMLDIGGESTRPGAAPLDLEEEWRRIAPVLATVRERSDVCISIDTYKAQIAQRAIELGADVINDISALTYEPALAGVIARSAAAVILMHNRGRSSDMYAEANYGDDVVGEILGELRERDAAARAAGIPAARIMLDPGLGFAKRAEHSIAAIAGMPRFSELGRPLLSGPSRKSFLKAALGDVPPGQRVWGTAAAVATSALLGAHIVRVHDVAEMVQVVRVVDLIRAEGRGQRAEGG